VKGIVLPPCTDLSYIYGPVVPVDQIIELPGGQAAKLGLKVGNRLKIEFLNAEENQESTKKTR